MLVVWTPQQLILQGPSSVLDLGIKCLKSGLPVSNNNINFLSMFYAISCYQFVFSLSQIKPYCDLYEAVMDFQK